MAEAKGNTAVPSGGDHDRVQMLSLKADGTPDQHNPEIIGDKDVAIAAAKRQFAEQAVSAVDVEKRGATVDTGVGKVEQDPGITDLQKAHESAASAAEKAAESAINGLSKDKGK
jgi:hypothetical protein